MTHRSGLFPYTTLFRSETWSYATFLKPNYQPAGLAYLGALLLTFVLLMAWSSLYFVIDRKSTRLNSSHSQISYAVFFLKKKIVCGLQYAPYAVTLYTMF